MTFQETALPGAFVIDVSPVRDDRGVFARTFCSRTFRDRRLADVFVQTNHVVTARRGTIRGLHYQLPPAAEAKLIRCVRGAIQDVMVDLRRGSPTFLQWHSEVLSGNNLRMVYVPAGFAHGFQTLEDGAVATYQVSAPYTPERERAVRYDDPAVNVAWLVPEVIVSAKDANWPLLAANFPGVEL
jgi:dTDP-4-dehydrorhamnose 3,5-epimerase